ncbi:phosphoribulokinase [Solirubrobacter soli]|uniref:phosphoribulokinase n=1 Tax=Solirubrobacter soli TaxID=363832 RepID=UPI0004090FB3|nr:phosphoribulokinase [Solirubrobacter soli]
MIGRPILLGVVGDSAAGKTTITRGLVRLLGEEHVTHIAADDYHRYDRKQRAERGITPLDPECNYVDIMEADFQAVRAGRSILKPVYRHQDGTFAPPVYVTPRRFTIVEGLLGYHTRALRECFDVRVFLAPPEDLRRQWKVDRDCSRRGYTTDQVLEELDRREADSAGFIRPQQRYADIVVSFMPGERSDPGHLDAQLTLRDGLAHPELAGYVDGSREGLRLVEGDNERILVVSGGIDPAYAATIEEAIWDRMHFASHLRSDRLGEFTIGTQLHRSESLALVQLLVLYHLATARAAVALGGESARAVAAPSH